MGLEGRFEGRIVKAISGFFYIHTPGEGVRQCRARGLFKLQGVTPLVGDYVVYSQIGLNEGVIEEVLERFSELIRPPVSNVDQVVLVFSLRNPEFTYLQMDKMIAMVESQHLPMLLVMTKADLPGAAEAYEHVVTTYVAMYPVLKLSIKENVGMDELKVHLAGKTSAFAGLSGVGKSTLLLELVPDANILTGSISHKNKKGRHTTRHVELFAFENGYVADTPGFSQYSFAQLDPEDLKDLFKDIQLLGGGCEFRGCLHDNEQGCKVKEAYDQGRLSASRYSSYIHLLTEIKELKARRYT